MLHAKINVGRGWAHLDLRFHALKPLIYFTKLTNTWGKSLHTNVTSSVMYEGGWHSWIGLVYQRNMPMKLSTYLLQGEAIATILVHHLLIGFHC